MSGMRSLNRATDSQSQFSGKRSRSSILEIDSWMPSEVRAISPLVDRLMRLIEGSQCVPGEEFDIELALREALEQCSRARQPGRSRNKSTHPLPLPARQELSIVVTDQGKGFDFEKTVGNGIALDPDSEHGRGIQLMKAYMDDVHFERGGSEVHMRKRSRTTSRS